jgi:transposase
MEFEELCKAFREEEVKTKHLKRKAQKKAEVKRTRAVKRDAQVTKEVLRKDILMKVEYQIKSVRERNAACNENVAFINKVFSRVRQAISE